MKLSGIAPRYGLVRMCGCAGLAKRSRKVDTAVGRYVDRTAPAVQKRIAKVLRRAGKATAKRVASEYRKITKADDDLVRRLLAQLTAEDDAAAVEGQLAYALRQAFKRQSIQGLTQVGVRADQSIVEQMDQAAKDYAETRGGELIKDLSGTTIDDMRRLFGRAIDEGMSADDLEEAVMEAGAFGEVRAEMIARTELAAAHVQGNVEGWRQSDQVVAKTWILGDLHDIEDECDDAVAAGEIDFEADFVDGIAWPPAHPRCICDVLPVLRESTTDEEP